VPLAALELHAACRSVERQKGSPPAPAGLEQFNSPWATIRSVIDHHTGRARRPAANLKGQPQPLLHYPQLATVRARPPRPDPRTPQAPAAAFPARFSRRLRSGRSPLRPTCPAPTEVRGRCGENPERSWLAATPAQCLLRPYRLPNFQRHSCFWSAYRCALRPVRAQVLESLLTLGAGVRRCLAHSTGRCGPAGLTALAALLFRSSHCPSGPNMPRSGRGELPSAASALGGKLCSRSSLAPSRWAVGPLAPAQPPPCMITTRPALQSLLAVCEALGLRVNSRPLPRAAIPPDAS